MSLAPRILAAAGLLAVPALLAIGSQALSRPAEVPPMDPQTVVVDLAPTGAADAGTTGDPTTDPPEPEPAEVPVAPSQSPTPAPTVPQPAPAPANSAGQGTPGLVEREVLGDDEEDDVADVELDEDVADPGGED